MEVGCMENNVKARQSLFSRTFTKEEALDRKRYLLIENSDVPVNGVSIKNAVAKAKAEIKAQLDSYSMTKKQFNLCFRRRCGGRDQEYLRGILRHE
jgi:hypothetical protein